MNSNRGDYLYCCNCGALNVLGERSCACCRMPLYYNCPDCAAFVDNTFPVCPNCGRGLTWPAAGTYYAGQYSTGKPSATAALILITCIILLVVTAFGLAINGSNSVTAVSNPFVITSSKAPVADTPQVQTSVSGAPVSSTPAPRYSYTAPGVTAGQSTSAGEIEITMPSTSASTASGTSSAGSRSSYMESVYPGWGHCSGGRCGGMTQ
jgi:hypothetical protein